MRFLKWARGLWYAHLRRKDIEILWPSCKEVALDMDRTRDAFLVYVRGNKAWTVLDDHEIACIVAGLR